MKVEDFLTSHIEFLAMDFGRDVIIRALDSFESLDELKSECVKENQYPVEFIRIDEVHNPFNFALFFNFSLYERIENESVEEPEFPGETVCCLYIPTYVFSKIAIRIIESTALPRLGNSYLKRYLIESDLDV